MFVLKVIELEALADSIINQEKGNKCRMISLQPG